jgi:hypothetical protein
MDVLTPGTATSSTSGSNLSEPISTSSVLIKRPTATNIDQEGTATGSTGSSVFATPSDDTLSDSAILSQSSKNAIPKANIPACSARDDGQVNCETDTLFHPEPEDIYTSFDDDKKRTENGKPSMPCFPSCPNQQ